MSKKLKTLSGHNLHSIATHNALYSKKPQLNGIACPECGEELFDTNQMVTLTSNPPQKNIHCSSCDYKGRRVC